MSVHLNSLGMLGLGHLSFPKACLRFQKIPSPSRVDSLGARGHSGVVYYLVGQCNRGAIRERGWLLSPLQEEG